MQINKNIYISGRNTLLGLTLLEDALIENNNVEILYCGSVANITEEQANNYVLPSYNTCDGLYILKTKQFVDYKGDDGEIIDGNHVGGAWKNTALESFKSACDHDYVAIFKFK